MKESDRQRQPGGWWYCLLLILLVGLVLTGVNPAFAQGGGSVPLTPADLSRFPTVGFYFGAFNPQGGFVRDLKLEDLQVLENNHARPVKELTLVQPGLQIIVAINPAPNMANKMGELTYFEYLKRDLQAWAQSQPPSSLDDFSLSTETGLQAVREKQSSKWAGTLAGYEPDLKNASPDMASLNQALDLATDPNPNPYMKRAILYITPLPAAQELPALPNLATRASQLGVRIYVWAVASPSEATPANLGPLQQLATATGGQFFAFTGKEALPNPNSYFDSLRYLYLLNFDSGMQESGTGRLVLRVDRADFQAVSQEQTYTLKIAPPNPIFMSPPSRIQRVWIDIKGTPALQPLEVPLRIMVEFPDGRQRPLKVSRLFVDGKVVLENSAPPFDKFMWPIKEYTTSAPHRLQVEVEDASGLKKSSIVTTVDVQVAPPQETLAARLFNYRSLAVVVALLAAGGVLFIALSGRRTLVSKVRQRLAARKKDVLTQPVAIRQDSTQPRRSAAAHAPTVPRPAAGISAPARLVRLSDAGHPIPASALPLNRSEVTFGSDPKQAIFALDSSSIDSLHARILRNPDGSFQVFDSQSIAGTWVNYAPVSTMGVYLQHGDLIHLGRLAFRFELSLPPQIKQPRVSPYIEEKI